MGRGDRISRMVSATASAITVALVGLPPIVLLLTEHQRLSGGLEAETELSARAITQLIGRNPDLWRFEQVRLAELLSDRVSVAHAESRRVLDALGEVVAEHAEPVPPPAVLRSVPLLDAGVPVARIEIARSFRGPLLHAGVLLLLLVPVGLVVHRLLCALPLGALRRSEDALRTERDRARSYLEAAGVALVILDPEGLVAQLNAKAGEILGRDRSDVVGRPWFSFFDSAERETVTSALATASSGSPANHEARVLRPDGGRRIVSWFVTQLDRERSGSGLLLSGVDVTVQRELELRAMHGQKLRAIGKLAGGIAHDLNNILSVVKGCSVALLEEIPGGHPHREDVLEILEASDRAESLTRSLLAFSRRRPLEARPEDLVEVLRRSEKLLRRLLREDVALEMALPGTPLTVCIDSVQLDSVLMNLVVNARDAMPQGGRIVIRARDESLDHDRARSWGVEPGGYALVTVTDSGVGMDEETLGRVFEPFFTTKEVGRGTGLGLAVSHGIMLEHGGGIRVASEPGSGTTVSLLLPIREAPVDRPRPPTGEAAGGTETVLVAEDDAAVRRALRRILERSGYTVLEAVDGAAAVREFQAHRDRVRLVLLDVVMPEMNGRQALDRIRAIHPGARALFLSGHAEDPSGRHAIDLSGESFLPKPPHPDQLLRTVRGLLDA